MLESLLSPAARRFVLVGGIGFLVDAAVLAVCVHWAGWAPLFARVPSFACAVTATWGLNRHYTFAQRRRHRTHAEYARYVFVQCLGAALNYGVFGACIASSPLARAYPVLALAVGSAVAMGFNFWAMQWLVFPASARR